jgi:hypothetical protein
MRTKRAVTALLAGGLVLVAGCSASSSESGTSSASVASGNGGAHAAANSGSPILGVRAAAPAAGPFAGPSAAASAPNQAGTAATTAQVASSASIVYTAQLTVRAASVSQATTRAAQIAQQAGGYVSQESASAGAGASASIELKIPVAGYASALGELSGLGTQLSLSEQAQDVTEQVADVNSQVTSDEAAIAQLRALLAHAGSVGDLLDVQNQINTEESALEQMQAQQRALNDETSYATVTVTVVGPQAKPVVQHKAKPSSPSVVGGAKAGWHALRVTVSWALAVLAAVAPFAVFAAVAAFAAYRARRWLARRHLGQLHD